MENQYSTFDEGAVRVTVAPKSRARRVFKIACALALVGMVVGVGYIALGDYHAVTAETQLQAVNVEGAKNLESAKSVKDSKSLTNVKDAKNAKALTNHKQWGFFKAIVKVVKKVVHALTCGACRIFWKAKCHRIPGCHNTCHCHNGRGTRDAQCPRNGHWNCASCNNGYFKSGTKCHLKRCGCSNGSGTHGTACPANGRNHCKSCNNGYFMHGRACHLKVCACTNGNGARGGACTGHGRHECASCHHNKGVYLNGNSRTCKTRVCGCSGGNRATGNACPSHGAHHCTSCHRGYHAVWVNGKRHCKVNVCVCSNGTGARHTACTGHGRHECASCHAHRGYYLHHSRTCKPRECVCANGKGTTYTRCARHGQGNCQSCNSGFTKVGNKCVQTTCKCTHGVNARGTTCPRHGSAKCTSCVSGYTLRGSTCIATPCRVPRPNGGSGHRWSGSSGCKVGGSVRSGGHCALKAHGFHCVSPGVCSHGKFTMNPKCTQNGCVVPDVGGDLNGLARWIGSGCAPGNRVRAYSTCSIKAKPGFRCTGSPGKCTKGRFRYNGKPKCVALRCRSPSSTVGYVVRGTDLRIPYFRADVKCAAGYTGTAIAIACTGNNGQYTLTGCHRDRDRDGAADALDECPRDARKSAEGKCGCGIRDKTAGGLPNCNNVDSKAEVAAAAKLARAARAHAKKVLAVSVKMLQAAQSGSTSALDKAVDRYQAAAGDKVSRAQCAATKAMFYKKKAMTASALFGEVKAAKAAANAARVAQATRGIRNTARGTQGFDYEGSAASAYAQNEVARAVVRLAKAARASVHPSGLSSGLRTAYTSDLVNAAGSAIARACGKSPAALRKADPRVRAADAALKKAKAAASRCSLPALVSAVNRHRTLNGAQKRCVAALLEAARAKGAAVEAFARGLVKYASAHQRRAQKTLEKKRRAFNNVVNAKRNLVSTKASSRVALISSVADYEAYAGDHTYQVAAATRAMRAAEARLAAARRDHANKLAAARNSGAVYQTRYVQSNLAGKTVNYPRRIKSVALIDMKDRNWRQSCRNNPSLCHQRTPWRISGKQLRINRGFAAKFMVKLLKEPTVDFPDVIRAKNTVASRNRDYGAKVGAYNRLLTAQRGTLRTAATMGKKKAAAAAKATKTVKNAVAAVGAKERSLARKELDDERKFLRTDLAVSSAQNKFDALYGKPAQRLSARRLFVHHEEFSQWYNERLSKARDARFGPTACRSGVISVSREARRWAGHIKRAALNVAGAPTKPKNCRSASKSRPLQRKLAAFQLATANRRLAMVEGGAARATMNAQSQLARATAVKNAQREALYNGVSPLYELPDCKQFDIALRDWTVTPGLLKSRVAAGPRKTPHSARGPTETGVKATGSMTSLTFQLKHDTLTFAFGGGSPKTSVTLSADGKVRRRFVPNSSQARQTVVWDVSELKYQSVTLVATDDCTASGIYFNDVRMFDSEPGCLPECLRIAEAGRDALRFMGDRRTYQRVAGQPLHKAGAGTFCISGALPIGDNKGSPIRSWGKKINPSNLDLKNLPSCLEVERTGPTQYAIRVEGGKARFSFDSMNTVYADRAKRTTSDKGMFCIYATKNPRCAAINGVLKDDRPMQLTCSEVPAKPSCIANTVSQLCGHNEVCGATKQTRDILECCDKNFNKPGKGCNNHQRRRLGQSFYINKAITDGCSASECATQCMMHNDGNWAHKDACTAWRIDNKGHCQLATKCHFASPPNGLFPQEWHVVTGAQPFKPSDSVKVMKNGVFKVKKRVKK